MVGQHEDDLWASCVAPGQTHGLGSRFQQLARGQQRLSVVPRPAVEEFEAAARRPLRTRMRYAFIHTYKPVLDDAEFRAFDTMEEYRRWCEDNLPDWLGYGRV